MKKAQAIRCKCGSVFAACTEPECYLDLEWYKEVRDSVTSGCTIEMVLAGDFEWEECKCTIKDNYKQPVLDPAGMGIV